MSGDAARHAHTEARLEALEVKLSFTEDTVERLNEVIVRQQQQIDRLLRAVAALTAQGIAGGPADAPRSLRDELPPHY